MFLFKVWCTIFKICICFKFSDEENDIDGIVMFEFEDNDIDLQAGEQGRNLRRDRIVQHYFS